MRGSQEQFVAKMWGVGFGVLCVAMAACSPEPEISVDPGVHLLNQGVLRTGQYHVVLTNAGGRSVLDTVTTMGAEEGHAGPRAMTALDSASAKWFQIYLRGPGHKFQDREPLSVVLGGQSMKVLALARDDSGRAIQFRIALGTGDTTVTIERTAIGSSHVHVVLAQGGATLYDASVDIGSAGASETVNCVGLFLEGVAGLSGGAAAFASSVADGPVGFVAGVAAVAAGVYAIDEWETYCVPTYDVEAAWIEFCVAIRYECSAQ